MDSGGDEKDCKGNQRTEELISNGAKSRTPSKVESKSSTGPVAVLWWVWNWFTTLPKTITNLYADLKSGELLVRFTFLDAMLQFIVAVATSCHPQEEPEMEEYKSSADTSASNTSTKDVKVFGGAGRTLRSRTVEAHS